MTLPIVAMTAHAMTSDRELSREAGMTAHVTKPIDPATLYRTLIQVLGVEVPAAKISGADASREATPALPERTPAPAAATARAPDFDIAGWDTKSGLARVAGNGGLYRRLLGTFAERRRGVAGELRDLMARGERDEAVRLAHSVKGIAGNLGATHTQEAAKRAEAALDEEGDTWTEAVDHLERALTTDLEALEAFLTADRAGKASEDAAARRAWDPSTSR